MSTRKRRSTGKLVVLNEEELIRQVHLRPLLYDRSLKSYRKASMRKQYWQEVSNGMDATVEECRRRWRSLRDSFAKHYKQVQRSDEEHVRNKHRKWSFYEQMSFMIPYLDSASYELDDHLIEEYGDNSEDAQSVHCEPEVNADIGPPQETQSIKLSSSVEDEHHHNNNDHVQQSTVSVQATDFMPLQEESIVMESHHHHQQQQQQQQLLHNGHHTEHSDFRRKEFHNNNTTLSFQSEIDSDEKFLLSCAPTLRRLTNRQNSMARLQIQQILFDIEFGERRNNHTPMISPKILKLS